MSMYKLNGLGLENLKNFVNERVLFVWNTTNEVPKFADFVKQYEDTKFFSMYFMQYTSRWNHLQHFADIQFDESVNFIKLGVNFTFDQEVSRHPIFKRFSDTSLNPVGRYLQENISCALSTTTSGICGIGTQTLVGRPEIYCNLKYIPSKAELEVI